MYRIFWFFLNHIETEINGYHFICILFNKHVDICIQTATKRVTNGAIRNKPAFVQIMARHWNYLDQWPSLFTHICIILSRLIKISFNTDRIFQRRLDRMRAAMCKSTNPYTWTMWVVIYMTRIYKLLPVTHNMTCLFLLKQSTSFKRMNPRPSISMQQMNLKFPINQTHGNMSMWMPINVNIEEADKEFHVYKYSLSIKA